MDNVSMCCEDMCHKIVDNVSMCCDDMCHKIVDNISMCCEDMCHKIKAFQYLFRIKSASPTYHTEE